MMKSYKRVLTIAGSDSGGGAGIQADIKSISACGCYAASAITAVTVQNTLGVQDVVPVPPSAIAAQIQAVLDDIGADAVKIGMLHSAEVVRCVAKQLARYTIPNIVLDPVMVSTSGHRLMEEDAVQALITDLIPTVRVITPNIPEAEILLGGARLASQDDLSEAAQRLAERTGVSVLLKAGHLTDSTLTDILYNIEDGRIYTYSAPRLDTCNTHGTGCTLSSALAAYLAQRHNLPQAVQQATDYIHEALAAGAEYQIGNGFGPVAHFYKYWK